MSAARGYRSVSPNQILRACVIENTETAQKFLENNQTQFENAVDLIAKALRNGNKLLICGNGGSAAESQHMAAEFVGTFSGSRSGLAALALTSDTATLTALGNDFGFDQIFARQVQAYGSPGDVLIVITTSGNSKNIIRAVEEAHRKKMKILALAGKGGGPLRKLVPDALIVPSMSTPRIQEVQILLIHSICALVEARLFPDLAYPRSVTASFGGLRRRRSATRLPVTLRSGGSNRSRR
jgi:D-sedoheptulose 7-phosphate isomerase